MADNTTALETVITARDRDLGGLMVRRVLPFRERRTVGPFIFLDQFGPLALLDGRSLEVAPHPHIGLATVTYLFSGKMMHRDSLGSTRIIQPGDVNWMTAGRGIVHAERTSQAANPPGALLSGVQTWVALPQAYEETDPAFAHHGVAELPELTGDGLQVKVILGKVFGRRSPVATLGEPAYADCQLQTGARLEVPTTEMEECAVCVVSGSVLIEGQAFTPGMLAAFKPGAQGTVTATEPARVMLLGGARLDGPRHIWWNFVSSSKDRIEAAKDDWRNGKFAAVPGETEFIPLPN